MTDDMNSVGTFAFGMPVLPLVQRDRTAKRAFVLGVYASAVHARWIGADGQKRIGAVAVASEPEIFWRGDENEARTIISDIAIPAAAGHLEPANPQFNGPSGKALDKMFLEPLRLSRNVTWLCDLVPHSCMNHKQAAALKREYEPVREQFRLPPYNWPPRPRELANEQRRTEIARELEESRAEVVITLGDEPLKWFTHYYGTKSLLSTYGQTPDEYGRLHPFRLNGRELHLLPLVHPRQAAKLGSHSPGWNEVHAQWAARPPAEVHFA